MVVVDAVGSVGNCDVYSSSYPSSCGQVSRPIDDLSKEGVGNLWAARPFVLSRTQTVHALRQMRHCPQRFSRHDATSIILSSFSFAPLAQPCHFGIFVRIPPT